MTVSRSPLNEMFDRGCGFTEFLVAMFYYLPWSDIENCRLVCSKWRHFIDRSAVYFVLDARVYPASSGAGMLVEAILPRGITTGGGQERPD